MFLIKKKITTNSLSLSLIIWFVLFECWLRLGSDLHNLNDVNTLRVTNAVRILWRDKLPYNRYFIVKVKKYTYEKNGQSRSAIRYPRKILFIWNSFIKHFCMIFSTIQIVINCHFNNVSGKLSENINEIPINWQPKRI